MARDDRTDQFRAVFDAEDIFDRFVKNANQASAETSLPARDDEPTGRIIHPERLAAQAAAKRAPAIKAPEVAPKGARKPARPPQATPIEPVKRRSAELGLPASRPAPIRRRGGPPSWDHEVTVKPGAAKPKPLPPYDDDVVEEGTRPDAPMPLSMARAFGPEGDEDSGLLDVGEDDLTALHRDASEVEDDALDVGDDELTELHADDPDEDLDVGDVDDEVMTVPRQSPLLTDSGQRILLLTKVKRPSRPPSPGPSSETLPAAEPPVDAPEPDTQKHVPPDSDDTTDVGEPSPVRESSERLRLDSEVAPVEKREETWESPFEAPGEETQRLQAERVVPDVDAASRRDVTFVAEGGEDGQMPTRQLDQILSDMSVLLRYGHEGQVQERLEELRCVYPEDLLLMRRLAEFYVEHDRATLALDPLFALASALFERRNVTGMRQVLEQVQKIEPGNARALRLLGLLEHKSG